MNTRSKSALFLIELIVVILVFALSSAICLRIFFQSRQTAAESRDLSFASLAVQSAADCYKSFDGNIKETAELLDGHLVEGELYLYYDANWCRVSDKNAPYYVNIIELVPGEEGIVTACSKESGPISSAVVRGGLHFE